MKKEKARSRLRINILARHKREQQARFKQLADIMKFLDELDK